MYLGVFGGALNSGCFGSLIVGDDIFGCLSFGAGEEFLAVFFF
jgi:hypothetical protein